MLTSIYIFIDYGKALKEPAHWRILDRQVDRLKESLDLASIIDHLRSRSILQMDDDEEIRNTPNPSDKIDILIGILRQSPPQSFTTFIDILHSTKQAHVAESLLSNSDSSSRSSSGRT